MRKTPNVFPFRQDYLWGLSDSRIIERREESEYTVTLFRAENGEVYKWFNFLAQDSNDEDRVDCPRMVQRLVTETRWVPAEDTKETP